MRPYLAILYDAFLEAIQSRVLWVLLAAWVLLLAAIAPFGFIEEKSYQLRSGDILQRSQLLEQLQQAAQGKGKPTQQAVVAALPESARKLLVEQSEDDPKKFSSGRLSDWLNEAGRSRSLYDPQLWPRVASRAEWKQIIEKDPKLRSEEEIQQLNRLLLEWSFPGQLAPLSSSQAWVGYAGLKVGEPLPVSINQARAFLELFVLQGLIKIGLGVVAMFVAIIVTSPMIPDTFQAGSLHLLLSKPISRTWLFLSKFAGGTIFVLIHIAFLLSGLYLIAGWRLGIWNEGLFLCIPLFLFVFMIFYSVSALAGLVWKNAIVSVVVTGVFWAICFALGLVETVMQPIVRIQPEVTHVQALGDQLLAARQDGALVAWDKTASQWQQAFDTRGGNRKILGPFWLPRHGELYFGRAFVAPFGINSDGVRLGYANLPEFAAASIATPSSAEPSQPDAAPATDTEPSKPAGESWFSGQRLESLENLPPRTRRAIGGLGTFLVLTDLGVYAFDRTAAQSRSKPKQGLAGMLRNAMERLQFQSRESYRRLTPEDWQVAPPADLALSADEATLWVYTQGKLMALRPEGDLWKPVVQREVSDEEESVALIAASPAGCLVVPAQGNRWTWCPTPGNSPSSTDLATGEGGALEPLFWDAPVQHPPRSLTALSDGRFAMVDSKGFLWMIDPVKQSCLQPPLGIQGKVVSATPGDQSLLWVAHHIQNVSSLNLSTGQLTPLLTTKPKRVEWIYEWLVHPIYWIFPKPSSVDATILYCLKLGNDNKLSLDPALLGQTEPTGDPWQPLWSNAAFVAVMLTLCCVYLYRQDL
jgi:ABC-type transport system involved in multi-copper enzyme maturation permease subunit